MSKPKFDPKKPYEVVDEVSTKAAKPKFDKKKPFTAYIDESLEAQEAIEEGKLQTAKDLLLLGAHGGSQDLLDEGAGVAHKLIGGDYTEGRDSVRQSIEEARARQGLVGDAAELVGNVGVSMALPGSKAAGVARELGLAAIQGAGSAKELEDVPASAALSAGVSGVTQGVGKVVGKVFDKPNKILARTSGARGVDFLKGNDGVKAPDEIAKRLDKVGFFRQGEVVFNPSLKKFVPNPTKGKLESFFSPQSLDDLHNRAQTAVTALRGRNDELLKNKKIPMKKVLGAVQSAAMDFIPDGFDYLKREQAASNIVDKVLMDLELQGKVKNGLVDALDVEQIKRNMQDEVARTFKQSADDLSLTPESLRKFSTKIDELVDTYGGPDYKANNDLMSDLLSQSEMMFNKVARESGYGVEAPRLTKGSMWDSIVDTFNPASVGVGRARVGQGLDTAPGQALTRGLKRAPVEIFNNNREPQSVGRMPQSISNIPEEFIRTPLPRTSEGLIKHKKLVLGKIAQMTNDPMLLEGAMEVYDHNPENLPELATMLSQKFPHFFEKDKYNRFDGRIVSEVDKQKAIKDTLLRTDISSIEQAKIITRLNKEGLYDH